MNIFNYHFIGLHGETLRLERYRNQPILLVNTASECKFTPHYTKLQQVYNDYKQSGLVVIGIPCNDFGEQEPGNEEEIANFLQTEYQITFPMTSKQSVIGIGLHAIFRDLLEEYGTEILPRWNFHKYLFDRRGALVENWPGEVPPDDPAVIHQVTRNLQSWSL